jgi:hypothetical protein
VGSAAKIGLVVAIIAVAALGGGLWWTMRDDAPAEAATPFDGGDIGHALLGCKSLCAAEAKCRAIDGTAADCEKDCETMIQARFAGPACMRDFDATLGCWWRASQRCAPADACADEVGKAFDCMCAQPNAPSGCTE